MTRSSRRVVVVGAGLAGLTAAYELAKVPGLEVVVLEARDRIGGRVLSRRIKGSDVDLGGFLIFPWYRHYRRLCAELHLDDELHRVPSVDVYFDLGDRRPIHEEQLDLRLSKLISVAAKSMVSSLTSGRLEHPSLDHYQRRTIEACIDDWVGDPAESETYKRLVDTICQGYCYPPISEYKAAFAMPIYPRTLLLGDATRSDMFRHGSRSLPEALSAAVTESGGAIRLGCEVTGFDGDAVDTTDGRYPADLFVFSQNADHPVMRDLLPRSKPAVRYTRFATAVVRLRDRYQPELDAWGAIFFAPDPAADSGAQVLSMIDLERLYADDSLRRHYTFNIRLGPDEPVDEHAIMAAIDGVCPESGYALELVIHEVWPQTMPVSDELVVETVRALQGVGGCYFAGDYLGCPSMEVALATGLDAARSIVKHHRRA